MRTSRSSRALLAAFAALGGFLSFANAQSVATDPVGAMTYSIPANATQSLGFPVLRPAVIAAAVSAGDATTMTLSGSGVNLASVLTAGVSYYVEVVGHNDGVTDANVGERFELNESATIASASGVVTLDTASSLNTSTGNFSALVGYQLVIRPHWTLGTLFGTGVGATNLNSSTAVTSADQVLAWGGASWSTYWFRQSSNGSVKEWRNTATGTTNQDSAIVPPGVGVYFKRKAGSLTVTTVGDIRTNKFVRNLDDSVQLFASGFPVDQTPVQMGFLPASGYTAGTAVTSADQLQTWTGTAFSTYWLRRNTAGDVIQWRNTSTGTTDHSNAAFINASQAVFIKPQNTVNDVDQNVPFAL